MNAQMDAAPPSVGPGSMSFNQPPKTFQLQGEIGLSLSVCETDFGGARALLDLILLLEPLNHVDLVLSIAGGPEILPEADWQDFHRKALSFFRKVHVNKVRDIRPMSEPSSTTLFRDWRPNNNMFRGVADWFMHFGKQYGAFYYLEPDCTPLKRDWFSKLCAAYVQGRKPFMGVIRQAKRNDGSMLPRHMNGSGFYPNKDAKGMSGVSIFSAALYAASMNQHPEAAPFDVAGGVTVVPQCQPTNLICVDFNANPVINPEAVVWHGDKRHQLKYTMIEELGGDPSVARKAGLQEGNQTLVTSPARPHFQQELTDDLVRMPERVSVGFMKPPMSDGTAFLPVAALQDLNRMASEPPRIKLPRDAYEAYSRALTAFGHDQLAWNKAVDDYTQKKLAMADAVAKVGKDQGRQAIAPVSISGGKAEAAEKELADIFD